MAIEMIACADDDGRRLDRLLRKALPALPLSALHRLLRQGRILVNGTPAEGADRVTAGSVITIPEGAVETSAGRAQQFPAVPAQSIKTAGPPQRAPAWGPLWEGAGLLILNKPKGIAVHGPESLETQVRVYLAERLPPSLSFRPGPLHRLDKPTSGIMVFSVSLEGARYFSALLRERRITKRYLALVDGNLATPVVWEDMLIRDTTQEKTFIAGKDQGGAKNAGTTVVPLASSLGYTLIMAEINTGRTHQIRAQAAFHGHPLAGDKKYGGTFQPGGFLLHAATLVFPPEEAPKVPTILQAPLPPPFIKRIHELWGGAVKIP
ncbi:MAG: RluA family pseudouridine synthase [Treponema sp.]|nr:RluA family pseudouridine synthase [Treponema sp.]